MVGFGGRARWWASGDVLLLVFGRFASAIGDAILAVVLLLRVHDQDHGFFPVALLLLCEALPAVVLMKWAGSIADTRDSRRVLTISTVIQALVCGAIAVTDSLMPMLALALLLQSAYAVNQATWAGLSSQIAGERNIGKLLSIQQGLTAVALPLGTAIGPVLVGLWGSSFAVLVDAATFALLGVLVQGIRTRRGGRAEGDIDRVTWGSFTVLKKSTAARLLTIAMVPAVMALVGVNTLEVFLVRDTLGVSTSAYGLVGAFFGCGCIIGSFGAASMGRISTRLTIAAVSVVACSALSIGMGLAPTFSIFLALSLAAGVANSVSNACYATILITSTPSEHRGRTAAAINGVFQTASLLGLPLGAVLGQFLGVRTAIVACGVWALCAATPLVLHLRTGRRRVAKVE